MAARHPRTTSLIVNGADYFVANLDNGGIRVGLRNNHSFDFPAGHRFRAVALELKTETNVEKFFDFLVDLYA